MLVIYGVFILAQVLVPIALLIWLGWNRQASLLAVLTKTLLAVLYIFAIGLSGVWLMLPVYTPGVYLAVCALAMWRAIRRHPQSSTWWPASRGGIAWLALEAIAVVMVTGLVAHAAAGRTPPPGPIVDLAFPLESGTYYVANGGTNSLVSTHVETLTDSRYRDYRGQSYAVDIVKLNRSLGRASGIAPSDPRRYAIFGDAIHAPCDGVVLTAVDGRVDMPPPTPDREHLAGNYTLLACGDDVQVFLGHMQRGTVTTRAGQQVRIGDVLGLVGNSGNTNEPHLHIHAQRPARTPAILSGDPLPIRFDGRFLVRNDRVISTSPHLPAGIDSTASD